MAGIFVLNVYVAHERTADPIFLILGAIGCVLNIHRIATSVVLRERAYAPGIKRADAARFEILFAVPYLSFALALGIFGFLIFRRSDPELHMLTICVAVGYCAGVAANCGLRPFLALGSIVLTMIPIIAAAVMRGDSTYFAMAVVAIALMVGAGRSMMVRFNESKSEIAIRISSVSMARQDMLTSLPNRLALSEFFAGRLALSAPETKIAVHYLDLDGFKPVNDEFGHAIGDQVLLAVAGRLRSTVRKPDMVARLAGDEFAIVQVGLKDAEEAYALSWRVRDTIQQPYKVDQFSISVTISIGTVISTDRSSTLDELLQLADEKLYGVKRARRKLLAAATARKPASALCETF